VTVSRLRVPKADEAVAEYSVVNEVVGNGQIEGLIEFIQRLGRPRQDCGCQNQKDCKRENNSATDFQKLFSWCQTMPHGGAESSDLRCMTGISPKAEDRASADRSA